MMEKRDAGFEPFPCAPAEVCVAGCRWEIVRELGRMPLGAGLLNVLLGSLVLMHIYWFGLMLQIAVQQLGTGSVSDTREDDGHDD